MNRSYVLRHLAVVLMVVAVVAPVAAFADSAIKVEKSAPAKVTLGHEYTYTIKVTNVTDAPVMDVVLADKLPKSFKMSSSNPAAKPAKDGTLTWALGTLAPMASKSVTITGVATARGTNTLCGTASYKKQYCVSTEVVEPKLELVKTAPAEVILCDPIPLKFVVKNPGSGTAKNVKIEDKLPNGLTTVDGKSTVTFDVGDLAPGASRELTATVKAAKTGKYVNSATATADDKLKATDKSTTIVRQPVLTLTKTGPSSVYLGRTATYTLKVTNTGDAVAANTIVSDTLPDGATFVSASGDGDESRNKVTWALGDLQPKASKTLTLKLKSATAQVLVNSAEATAKCAKAVSATAKTTYKGIPAILLEVVDLNDPVEVGKTTTYEIIAVNQGTAPGTNIKIVCTLEANEKYLSSTGNTKATVKGAKITFAPVASLAPGAKAVWRVVVEAVKAGDVRFKVAMTSDQLKRSVDETEATNLYK
jgi:uncharacterized repeat protein (TIGR01451 family)